jgi:hypothetical protein
MKILDFMVGTGELAKYNFVFVTNNEENVSELKKMGCTDDEISSMRSEDDHYLEIYQVLNKKGYSFSAQNGFYKETERNKKWN